MRLTTITDDLIRPVTIGKAHGSYSQRFLFGESTIFFLVHEMSSMHEGEFVWAVANYVGSSQVSACFTEY